MSSSALLWSFRYLTLEHDMPTDIIEMFWGCLTCHKENKGRFKTCQKCGKPRTSSSPEWMPDDISPMAAIKDQALLDKFTKGSDWHCKFCSSSTFRADDTCAQCGSPRASSLPIREASIQNTPILNIPNISIPEVPIISSESEPPPFMEQRGGYREPATRKDPEPVSLDTGVPSAKLSDRVASRAVTYFDAARVQAAKYAAIGLGALVFITILYFLFRTKEVDARVEAVSWDRVVHVDRYSVWHHDGWDPDNGAFHIRDEGRRIHHYDHVRIGSHTEHYTERVACGQDCRTIKGSCYTTSRTCTSNKNGSATCTGGDRVCSPDTQSCTTKYCNQDRTRSVDDYEEQPRYRTWYSWDVWEWHHNRDVHETGSSVSNVEWPSEEKLHTGRALAEGEQERIAGRDQEFRVEMRDRKEVYTYKPKDEKDFARFSVGSVHHLEVGIASGVKVIR